MIGERRRGREIIRDGENKVETFRDIRNRDGKIR